MSELEPRPLPDVSVDAYERLISPLNEGMEETGLTAELQEELVAARFKLLSPESPAHAQTMLHMLWGYQTASEQQIHAIQTNMRDRLGDSLFLLTRTIQHKGLSLEELLRDATAMFEPIDTDTPVSFSSLDKVMLGKMGTSVHPSYAPEYDFMEQQGVDPFEITDDGCEIMADGYYALHCSLSYLSNLIYLSPLHYLEAASQALTVISAVAQSRLDSSLQQIVNHNTIKLRYALRNGCIPAAPRHALRVPISYREHGTGKFVSITTPPSMN